MKFTSVDYSDGAELVLKITHITKEKTESYYFDHLDEDKISNFIAEHIGEQINSLNGCPIFMEVAGWAYNYCDIYGAEYSLESYDVEEKEWKIEILYTIEDKT